MSQKTSTNPPSSCKVFSLCYSQVRLFIIDCPALLCLICENSPGAATAHVTFGWPPSSAPPVLNITAPPEDHIDIEQGCEQEDLNPSEDNPEEVFSAALSEQHDHDAQAEADADDITRSENTTHANAQLSVVDHADYNLFISGPY